jgi:hypothetical protein
MKKLILIIALLCISTSALAVEPIDWSRTYALSTAIQAAVSAGGAAAPACNTEADKNTAATRGQYIKLGDDANQNPKAIRFTAGSSYTACKVKLFGVAVGSVSGTITVSIFSSADTATTTLLGTASGAVNKSSFGGSETEVEFTGMSASISSGTDYYLVMTPSSNDASNYIYLSDSSYSGGKPYGWWNTSYWNPWESTSVKYVIYK